MRKSINFDLSTNALLEHFSHTGIPYSQLKNFMLENGFEHDQYSGYVSIKINERGRNYSSCKRIKKRTSVDKKLCFKI